MIIGIIGGIGSGKSSVAGEFANLGCKVIDADAIVHNLLAEQDVRAEIVAKFGEAVTDGQGGIDRRRLGEIAFSSAAELKKLTDILHWRVLERAEGLIEGYNGEKGVIGIVLDMPLLVEVGWAERCEKLVFVDCSREKRIERARKKARFDEKQLKKREKFQISLDKKKILADNTVDNNSDYSAMVNQVAVIFKKFLEGS